MDVMGVGQTEEDGGHELRQEDLTGGGVGDADELVESLGV